METKKVQALIETVKIGSINKAAEELGYTQSGLTYILNALEGEMGVKIINRNHNGISLSPVGKKIYPLLVDLVKKDCEIYERIENMKLGEEIIRVGAYSSLMLNWLPNVVRSFRMKNPNVNFELRTGVVNLMNWLDDSAVDIVICESFFADGRNWQYIADDEMCVAIHKSLPLAKKNAITLEMLKDYQVIFPSLLERNVVSAQIKERDIAFKNKIQLYTEDGSVTLSMTSQMKGVSFVTKLYGAECPDDLVLRSLEPKIIRQIGAVVSENKQYSSNIREFVNYMKRREFVY